ncbi:hypothetical protein FF011L_39520 [Roseimaritima multifibrata]|uniref:DUF1598 domain-containing protein n=1 Tax=Roseimaritima multifibrata TaxID=1930274 RepID=A0A517MJU2_9BACT|nr:DUF1598 domain-containing protein [Roseimaritima multifibrata]QDS95165.1 hypothetical protein FF011L_39520 [Roseimaritima multifibrata]
MEFVSGLKTTTWRDVLFGVLVVGLSSLVSVEIVHAQAVVSAAAAGEFAVARAALEQAPANQRDPGWAGLAEQQAAARAWTGASRSLSHVADPADQAAGIRAVRDNRFGAGSLADFSSLMNLIQTTVAPESWEETMGGPSTMAPYYGGIVVDSSGLVTELVTSENLRNRSGFPSDLLLAPSADAGRSNDSLLPDWTRPAKRRYVSLKRLGAEWVRIQALGKAPSASLYNLAGLSEVDYVFIDSVNEDVVLSGPVGGIVTSDDWPRDRLTGNVPWQLPMLLAVVQAVESGQSFGCTIDPTNKGIAQSLQVAERIGNKQIPVADAAEAMREALGRQRVEVFGTEPDSMLAWFLVDADRHMKQLALEQHPLPDSVPSYLDQVTAMIGQGVPSGTLLRLWFTGQPLSVQADADRTVFKVTGVPCRLVSEDQRPDVNGNRRPVATDPRSHRFVRDFNQHLPAISRQYPIYHSLQNLYRMAAVAQLLKQHVPDQVRRPMQAPFLVRGNTTTISPLPVPTSVDSIAVMQSVRHGSKRHHIIVASGGIHLDPTNTLQPNLETYQTLASVRSPAASKPTPSDHWWWDGNELESE